VRVADFFVKDCHEFGCGEGRGEEGGRGGGGGEEPVYIVGRVRENGAIDLLRVHNNLLVGNGDVEGFAFGRMFCRPRLGCDDRWPSAEGRNGIGTSPVLGGNYFRNFRLLHINDLVARRLTGKTNLHTLFLHN